VDIHHIRYFLAVCETLNFTRAAELCQVTQPALSRAIQQLEDEVGGLLFRRERNLTHLTDLGLLMKPRLEKIVGELGDVQREAKRFLTLDSANLMLGIMCTIGPTRFTSILGHFYASCPGISVNLVEGTPDKLAAHLEGGEIDIALMARPEGFSEKFVVEPLYRERFLVAFPAGHRFADRNAISMADVNGENYLSRVSCEYDGHISGILKGSGCGLNTVYESEREDWIQNMVAGGLGICFIPEFSAVIPGLQTRPVIEPEVWREVCLVTIAGRQQPAAVASFVKALKDFPWPQSRFAATQAAA
jgi:LysR family hydrogen peroxide-inducible transcriptional activator